MPRYLTTLLFALSFLAACAWHAEAAGMRTLSLDEALVIAGERNRTIARAIEFRRQTEGIYVAERSAALPRFTVLGSYIREEDNALGTAAFDHSETAVQFDQTLFTWGQVQAAIRAARLGMQTADERLRASRQDALRDAAAAFYDVLLARELHDVFAQTLAQKSRRLDEARKRQNVGLATDYDVLVAEVATSNARPEVVRTDNLIRSRRDRLRLILGLGEAVDARGQLATVPVEPPVYDDALAVAYEHRPELRDLRHRIGIAGELVTIARAGDKPRLDLVGSYGWRDFEPSDSDNDNDNGNDSGRDRGGSGETWDLGVRLTWPLFDGLRASGEVQQANSELAGLRIDEQQLLDTIGLELRETIDRVHVAIELVNALDGTVAQAEKLLRLSEKGFEYGVKIRLEVDDAELSLRQARSSLALARRDYLVAMVDLARAMGILGERTFPGLPVALQTALPTSR